MKKKAFVVEKAFRKFSVNMEFFNALNQASRSKRSDTTSLIDSVKPSGTLAYLESQGETLWRRFYVYLKIYTWKKAMGSYVL